MDESTEYLQYLQKIQDKYQIGGNGAPFCVACGGMFDNGSKYNLCFDCWIEYEQEHEEDLSEDEDPNVFVPTNAPLSCHCGHRRYT